MKKHALLIPVLNEGEKLRTQLHRLRFYSSFVDIFIIDGGSSDQNYNEQFQTENHITNILFTKGEAGLGKQLALGMHYAIKRGYEGVITMDGNNKDNPEAILRFIRHLKKEDDFIQGSRFLPLAYEKNTPLYRKIGIRLLHAPIINFRYNSTLTDTTNGFRAYSKKFLLQQKEYLLLPSLEKYELQIFLLGQALEGNYKTREIPVSRVYPSAGPIPTKISLFRGNFNLIRALFGTIFGIWKKPIFTLKETDMRTLSV